MIAYKLVPVEPTEEMMEAGHYAMVAGCHPGGIYADMLDAAPTVQEEPVGWQFYQDGKWWNGDDRIKDHRKNTVAAGIPVRDVYTASQPTEQKSTACVGCEGAPVPGNSPCAVCGQKSALDTTLLVEALECALETMLDVDGENDCSRGIEAVEEALAAYRNQGGCK